LVRSVSSAAVILFCLSHEVITSMAIERNKMGFLIVAEVFSVYCWKIVYYTNVNFLLINNYNI
jgi:hypothetical protein